uniref:Uncharacterized protein n=1 Tax=Cyprinus carpio TaxID=7962 RepID=A0A8C1V5B2_CYPCA
MDVDQPDPAEAGTTDETNICNGHTEEPSSKPQTKSLKTRPPSLKVKAPLNGVDPNEVDDDPPILPKGSYNFDPDQFEDAINPFATRGSKLQNSPPANASIPKSELMDEMPAQPVMLEFGLDDAEAKRPPPKKSGKKSSSKLTTPKKQRPKAAETAAPPQETTSEQDQAPSEDVAPMNVDDISIPKKSYNFDPSQWDDPNFNPFGGNSKLSNLPTLPERSYNFDPDNFDDSIDPFKPTKTLGGTGHAVSLFSIVSILSCPPFLYFRGYLFCHVACHELCLRLNCPLAPNHVQNQSSKQTRAEVIYFIVF